MFCLTTVGVALVLGARGRRTASRAFGAAVVVLPVLTLIESTTGWDIDSDLLLLGDAPDRLQAAFDTPDQMAPVAAVALLLLAVGLVAQGSPRLSHGCGLAAGVAGYLALAGHLYGVEGVLEVGGSTAVPLHGGALLLVAALGLLCLTPDAGLVQLLREPGNMGTMVRQLSVFALVVPVIVGSVFWAGERAGWYGTAAGVALTTMAWTAGTLMIIWLGGRRAVPVERERDESLAHAVEVRDRLQMVAEASRDFAVTPDLDATLQRVAVSVGRRLGGGCTIRLIDPTGTLLLPVALHHPDPERLAALAAIFERPLAIDEGLSGHVIASGSAGIVERYSPSSLGFIRDPALVGALEEYGRPSAVVALPPGRRPGAGGHHRAAGRGPRAVPRRRPRRAGRDGRARRAGHPQRPDRGRPAAARRRDGGVRPGGARERQPGRAAPERGRPAARGPRRGVRRVPRGGRRGAAAGHRARRPARAAVPAAPRGAP